MCSSVHPSIFSKVFSETAWSIKAKIYMKQLLDGGTNLYINKLGHMPKMATMPIYGTNSSKIFSGTQALDDWTLFFCIHPFGDPYDMFMQLFYL